MSDTASSLLGILVGCLLVLAIQYVAYRVWLWGFNKGKWS